MVETADGTSGRSRKADILRAAEREFASAGYAGGRVERIAAAAEVNKQLLFHYYDSKEGLFAAAVLAMLERLGSAGRPAGSPADGLRESVSDLLAGLRAAPGIVGIVAGAHGDPEFPAAAASVVNDWKDRLLARMRDSVAEGQRRGYFRDDVDPQDVSAIAAAAAIGLVALDLDGASVPSRQSPEGPTQMLNQLLADYCAWR